MVAVLWPAILQPVFYIEKKSQVMYLSLVSESYETLRQYRGYSHLGPLLCNETSTSMILTFVR